MDRSRVRAVPEELRPEELRPEVLLLGGLLREVLLLLLLPLRVLRDTRLRAW